MFRFRKNYNFSEKTHSKTGKIAVCLAAASFLVLMVCVIQAIRLKGQVSEVYGFACLIAFIFNVIGMIMSISSYKEEESLRLFMHLGVATNGVLLVLYLAMFINGLIG